MAAGSRTDRRARRGHLRIAVDKSELVRRIDRAPSERWQGIAWRHVAAGRPALSGEGARVVGGRWNPRGSFAVLYLGTSQRAVVNEFHRLAKRQRLDASQFLPRTLYRYDVDLANVLNLSVPTVRDVLEIDEASILVEDLALPQSIGEAAFAAGRTAILAPSAAGPDDALAVFSSKLGNDSTIAEEQIEIWETVPEMREGIESLPVGAAGRR